MEIKVQLSNLRIAPRKTRDVIDLIRGKKATDAKNLLSFTIRKGAPPVLKLLNSAIASAHNDFHIDESNLFVSKIFADEGTKLKRWHPMSRGRAYPIEKRTSHITIVLSEITPTIKKEETKKEVKPEKKVEKSRKTKHGSQSSSEII